jgi:hypothetical protein
LRTPALHLIKSSDLRYFWRIGSEFTRLACQAGVFFAFIRGRFLRTRCWVRFCFSLIQ